MERYKELHFQAIFDGEGNKKGCEVLTRIIGKNIEEVLESFTQNDKIAFDFDVFRKVSLIFHKINEGDIHINIHSFTIRDNSFFEKFELIFRHFSKEDMKKISLEILETGIISEESTIQIATINKNIEKLQSIGVKVGIDDYPKGNSKILLNNLKNIDFVKIDKQYLLEDEGNNFLKIIEEKLIKKIKYYQKNADIIIEGVENMNYCTYLKKLGIKLFQGYGYHKPEKIK